MFKCAHTCMQGCIGLQWKYVLQLLYMYTHAVHVPMDAVN